MEDIMARLFVGSIDHNDVPGKRVRLYAVYQRDMQRWNIVNEDGDDTAVSGSKGSGRVGAVQAAQAAWGMGWNLELGSTAANLLSK
jgi:hypothetical protein